MLIVFHWSRDNVHILQYICRYSISGAILAATAVMGFQLVKGGTTPETSDF